MLRLGISRAEIAARMKELDARIEIAKFEAAERAKADASTG